MTYAVIKKLLDNQAPDADVGWTWLRTLHEMGYEPVDAGAMVSFKRMTGASAMLVPMLANGKVRWLAMAYYPRAGDPSFEDPVTAAVWWQTELASQPQEEQIPRPEDFGKAQAQVAAWGAAAAQQAIHNTWGQPPGAGYAPPPAQVPQFPPPVEARPRGPMSPGEAVLAGLAQGAGQKKADSQ